MPLPAVPVGDLCRFRDALGAPRRGVHAYRTPGDLAAVDIAMTLAVAVLIGCCAPLGDGTSRVATVIAAFFGLWAIGTALHVLFCVRAEGAVKLGLVR
jgi:hypothetical protein